MDGFREGIRFATDVGFLLRGQCAQKSGDALFCTPPFMPFWPNLDPPRVPFWKFLIFETFDIQRGRGKMRTPSERSEIFSKTRLSGRLERGNDIDVRPPRGINRQKFTEK